ncbi:hypothetical protein Kpol_1002p64 [Vanderwaltozyma polyspora DSM 70294]|uniref:Spindle assembly checkpoint component MAD1 n=1 Tax=Vanderwaltozyma polyspora (strain ATCC 22028 / DSM 70294 / BCRC 21397 / CBS 2163 / NBRC 10782 / NRRL Y-8283 / UCD 57-17) TaxID=436907 RepID=A7TE95_VANPO|nr:uncharacterized protein Kpol_1002p64 [Vanderwaltozyma polyspora DSM 70294]EDO19417.1 hypothetical protein Kpol_1002p64 [Vanderwaltozyma polyspora DSM 70294]
MSNSGGSSPFLDRPNIEDLRKEDDVVRDELIKSLEYELNTVQNEFEIQNMRLQRQYNHLEKQYKSNLDTLEKTLNDMQELHVRNESLNRNLSELKKEYSEVIEEKEIQFKTLNSDYDVVKEECEFLRNQYQTMASRVGDQEEYKKLETEASQNLIKMYENELSKQNKQIISLKKLVTEKDGELEDLKANGVIKTHQNYNTEELQELTVVNKLLKDQQVYVKELEEANMQQANELKKIRLQNESHHYWKNAFENLQKENSNFNATVQDLELENIKLKSQLTAWEAYGDDDKPDNILRELRLSKEEYKNLAFENEKLVIDMNNMKELNDEMAQERNQLLEIHSNFEVSVLNLKKLNHEIEQQKLLSFEECKILRKQLDDYLEAPESKMVNIPTKEVNNLKNLENMVDDYKSQTEDLTNELKKLNDQLMSQEPANKKRKTSDQVTINYSKRLNELQIENIRINKELQNSNNVVHLLEEKLKKLINLKERKIRILQLRDSPLLKDQFIKKKQLELLKAENEDLLSNIINSSTNDSIPRSVFETISFELQQKEEEIFKTNKKFIRLKEMFNKKSLEFIDVVNSLLGFKLEFQQDGRVKIFSCFKPDRYLMADLTKNTLKSNLQTDVDNFEELLHLWVEDRGQIPCFLAKITLLLWESSNKYQ